MIPVWWPLILPLWAGFLLLCSTVILTDWMVSMARYVVGWRCTKTGREGKANREMSYKECLGWIKKAKKENPDFVYWPEKARNG